jgi:hypothetical protein
VLSSTLEEDKLAEATDFSVDGQIIQLRASVDDGSDLFQEARMAHAEPIPREPEDTLEIELSDDEAQIINENVDSIQRRVNDQSLGYCLTNPLNMDRLNCVGAVNESFKGTQYYKEDLPLATTPQEYQAFLKEKVANQEKTEKGYSL